MSGSSVPTASSETYPARALIHIEYAPIVSEFNSIASGNPEAHKNNDDETRVADETTSQEQDFT